MRRDVRKRMNQDDDLNMKIIKYSCIGIASLAIIVFGLLMYSKSLNDEVKEGTLTSEQISSILNNTGTSENTESASTEIGKSVNELENELKDNTVSNNTISSNELNSSSNTTSNTSTNVLNTSKITSTTTENKNETEENNVEEKTVELNFAKPVEGDIVRDFAVESLIYSETLQ